MARPSGGPESRTSIKKHSRPGRKRGSASATSAKKPASKRSRSWGAWHGGTLQRKARKGV